MPESENLLAYLTRKPKRDENADRLLEEKYRQAVAEVFAPVAEDIRIRGHLEYMLLGGRGSCKSSFVSCTILRELRYDPLGNALIIRKVGNTLRDSVFAQMLWAVDILGLEAEWVPTVFPMELTNAVTGQKIYFRGLDEPRKLKSLKPKKGYFSVVWFEELDELDNIDAVRSVVQSAGRGKGAKTITVMSFNPPKSANNWVNREALADVPELLLKCLRPGGKIIAPAYAAKDFVINSQEVVIKEKEIVGLRGATTQDFRDTIRLVEEGVIVPFVSKHFRLEEINEALDYLRASKSLGRSVLVMHED